MSNTFAFVGRLGKDAESKDVGGHSLLEMNVAHDVGWGEKKQTIWTRCNLWGTRGEKLAQYMKKGQQVFIQGEMSLATWTNNDGVEKTSVEIRVGQVDLVGSKGDGQATQQQAPQQSAQPKQSEDMPF